MSAFPGVVVVFCGKRKSGKDFVTAAVQERLGDDLCCVLRISAPLKEQYAKEHNLDFSRLLDASEYKEKYRADMIKWGEEKREKDPGFFCRIVCSSARQSVWIISDARRTTDVHYFKATYPGKVITVRVCATDAVRKERGWLFQPGVDDAESECGLDRESVDVQINNNSDPSTLQQELNNLVAKIKQLI